MLFSSVSPNFQEQSVSLITFCLWNGEKHLRSLWWSCEHPSSWSELQSQTPLLSPNPREEYKYYESWAPWRTAPSMQGNKQLVSLKPSCLHPAMDFASISAQVQEEGAWSLWRPHSAWRSQLLIVRRWLNPQGWRLFAPNTLFVFIVAVLGLIPHGNGQSLFESC